MTTVLIRSQSIFSSAKILGDFFLRSASGEENFPTRPEASGLKHEKFLLRLPLKIITNFDSEKTDCARIQRTNLKSSVPELEVDYMIKLENLVFGIIETS